MEYNRFYCDDRKHKTCNNHLIIKQSIVQWTITFLKIYNYSYAFKKLTTCVH